MISQSSAPQNKICSDTSNKDLLKYDNLLERVIEITGMYFYSTKFCTRSVIRIELSTSDDYDMVVDITTRRPGVLIGKKGDHINGLKEHLAKELDMNVGIKIIEDKLWSKTPIWGEQGEL